MILLSVKNEVIKNIFFETNFLKINSMYVGYSSENNYVFSDLHSQKHTIAEE